MKTILNIGMKTYLIMILTGIVLTFPSCKKDSENSASNQPGAIKGIIAPSDGAAFIICTPVTTGTALQIINPIRNFEYNNLPPGKYIIKAVPKLGFDAPAPITVTIAAGNILDVGTITMLSNGQSRGFLRFKIDTDNFDFTIPDVSASLVLDTISINANTMPAVAPYWAFKFKLANVTSTGSVTAGPFTATTRFVQATRYTTAPATLIYTTAGASLNPGQSSGSATFNITELNYDTRVMAGTFTTVLRQTGISGQVKRMNEGSFRLNF